MLGEHWVRALLQHESPFRLEVVQPLSLEFTGDCEYELLSLWESRDLGRITLPLGESGSKARRGYFGAQQMMLSLRKTLPGR